MILTFDKSDSQTELFYQLRSAFQLSSVYRGYNHSGIYAIIKDGMCLYVGQSKNVPSRISTHLSGKYKNCDFIKVYSPYENGFCDFDQRKEKERKAILDTNEKYLIKNFKPIENVIADYDFVADEEEIFEEFIKIQNDEYVNFSVSIMNGDFKMAVSDCDFDISDFSIVSKSMGLTFDYMIHELFSVSDYMGKKTHTECVIHNTKEYSLVAKRNN